MTALHRAVLALLVVLLAAVASITLTTPAEASACRQIGNSRSSAGPFWVRDSGGTAHKVNPGSGSGCMGKVFWTGCRYKAYTSSGSVLFGCRDTTVSAWKQGTLVTVR